MKKYFIFAAIAAAGLFASCSSSDDAISEAPVNPIQETDFVPIKIGVAKPIASITRGTGTVGGVVNGTDAANNDGSTTGTPLANSWAGQTVNVYMFNHGTLDVAQFTNLASANPTAQDIYNNAVLTTPSTGNTGVADYLVDENDWTTPGTAERYVKYYPMTGNYDFWGYRIDDATAADPAKDGDVLKTVISVNGTQDVLSGVANIPANYAGLAGTLKDAVDAYAAANGIAVNEDAYTAYKANRLFSASAARANVQPELVFSHMMTRLTFDAYAGSNNAKAYTENGGNATEFDAGTDTYQGVYVAGIKVRAISSIDETNPTAPVVTYVDPTKGTFEIAGTDAAFKPSLTWDDADAQAVPAAFELMKRDPNAATPANANLIPLIDVTDVDGNGDPNYDTNGAILLWNTATDGSVKNTIGEAIIAPSAAAYEIDIILCQKVVTKEEVVSGDPVDSETVKWSTIKKTFRAGYDSANNTTFFQPGTSYNFSIKVYGLERIAITTTLTPWEFGENVDVDTDN